MKISSTNEVFYFKVLKRKKKRIAMPKIMQNLVVLMDSSHYRYNSSMKGVNMCFNRFCIDEDAEFELSGVHYFEKPSDDCFQDKSKGKEYSCLLFTIKV